MSWQAEAPPWEGWHGPCCSALLWALVPQVCFRLGGSCLTLEPPRPQLGRSRGGGTAEGGFLQQVPGGEGAEEHVCDEASLFSLPCLPHSFPPHKKTVGRAGSFLLLLLLSRHHTLCLTSFSSPTQQVLQRACFAFHRASRVLPCAAHPLHHHHAAPIFHSPPL